MSIKKLRLENRINTYSASKLLDISKSMLYKIEAGSRSPSKKVIVKMSKIYSCSIDEIFRALKIKKEVS